MQAPGSGTGEATNEAGHGVTCSDCENKVKHVHEEIPVDPDFSGDVTPEYLALPICDGCGRRIMPADLLHTFCYPGID